MKFLANENFSGQSVELLKSNNVDVIWITEISPGISDQEVMKLAIDQNRTIITHDSDYGELVFKHGIKPIGGVVYFRLSNFLPKDPGKILMRLINESHDFSKQLTVIDKNTIRIRKY